MHIFLIVTVHKHAKNVCIKRWVFRLIVNIKQNDDRPRSELVWCLHWSHRLQKPGGWRQSSEAWLLTTSCRSLAVDDILQKPSRWRQFQKLDFWRRSSETGPLTTTFRSQAVDDDLQKPGRWWQFQKPDCWWRPSEARPLTTTLRSQAVGDDLLHEDSFRDLITGEFMQQTLCHTSHIWDYVLYRSSTLFSL